MKLVKTISAFVFLGVITTSCGEKKQAESTEMTDSTAVAMDTAVVVNSSTIVDVAAGNADFSTLVTAVKAAGLVETLVATAPLQFLHQITQHLQNFLKELLMAC